MDINTDKFEIGLDSKLFSVDAVDSMSNRVSDKFEASLPVPPCVPCQLTRPLCGHQSPDTAEIYGPRVEGSMMNQTESKGGTKTGQAKKNADNS